MRRNKPTALPARSGVLPALTALVLATAAICAPAQDTRLPDIGSSAGGVLSPARQSEYGQMLLAQLRHYNYVLEDPLVDNWLRGTGIGWQPPATSRSSLSRSS